MTNRQHLEGIIRTLEAKYTPDAIYDYFSAFHDVVVKGQSSSQHDNPHDPTEQPSHNTYHIGAIAAEKLMSELRIQKGRN
jgi:hypothetical protein